MKKNTFSDESPLRRYLLQRLRDDELGRRMRRTVREVESIGEILGEILPSQKCSFTQCNRFSRSNCGLKKREKVWLLYCEFDYFDYVKPFLRVDSQSRNYRGGVIGYDNR